VGLDGKGPVVYTLFELLFEVVCVNGPVSLSDTQALCVDTHV
jgi:hypothetical protein